MKHLFLILWLTLGVQMIQSTSGQNVSATLKANYRLTPVYLGNDLGVVSLPRHIPFQLQDEHLSGNSISMIVRFFFNKKKNYYLLFETGVRHDHLFYEHELSSGGANTYGQNVSAWMTDYTFGLGANLFSEKTSHTAKKMSIELGLGLFNRGSNYVQNPGNDRRSNNYHYIPLVFNLSYGINRLQFYSGLILQLDEGVFDFIDDPFLIPQLSIGYEILQAK